MAQGDDSTAENTQENTKKTSKKVTKKATDKTRKRAARAKRPEPKGSDGQPAASFDRSALGEKTRVFQLAKQLGRPSKELVVALNELGLVKVAQSTLTRAEAEQLLDALSGPTPASTDSAPAEAADADEKIRHRVRKDVENEINQIEEKVDAELEAARAHEEEPGVAEDSSEPAQFPEPEDGPLTNIEPEITPAPDAPGAVAYTPLFKPPTRAERRRARRAADNADSVDARDTDTDATHGAAGSAPADIEAGSGHADAPEVEVIDEPKAIKGSSRLEAQRRRRDERREEGRKRSRIVSQAEFLARRESVERTMVVRERERHDGPGRITQVGVLEDGLLVEHFVTSDQNASMIGNIYLGRVQNVLPSMEAAFIDIGQGRNGVLYAGEVDWKAAGLGGRSRRIEQALKSGDQVVVQVTKDPIGHKGARLTTQISLAGRYLVYVPGGRSAGISRKLPAPERKRLKEILAKVVPGKGGAIIRTAAENVPEEAIAADVNRLHTQWESIQENAEKEKKSKGAKPVTLYEEPNLLIKVVRDLFNDDFSALVVDGKRPWNTVSAYVNSVAPDLADRLERFDRAAHEGRDAFEVYRVDEQIQKALSRTVWLPSGGTLVIDRTEAMTVIDVNTGKFTGSGGSLEETVTRNNLEAAEEIVRQMRLRDLGGMIIVDFIDMILPENQDLVLRRLKEALGRDRTRHQVSEVTSLGLVQMTRKRLGTGLLETFSTPCECCGGRGLVLSDDPVDADTRGEARAEERRHKPEQRPAEAPAQPAKQEKRRDIALDEDALRELADSVVGGESEPETERNAESKAEPEAEDPQARESQPRGRRRGRRGGSRGRGREETPAKDTKREEAPAPAEQNKGASYEEALQEFESSPRRKRRTRGNSRSDHAPRRDDFEAPAAQQPAAEKPAAQEPKQVEEKREAADKPAARTGGKGRRRAVRRSNASVQAVPEAKAAEPRAEETAERGKGARQQRSAESPKSQKPQQPQKAADPRGRGRRRATRRRTS